MSVDVAKVIALARAQLGVVEATGRNDHPMIIAYLNRLREPPTSTVGLDVGASYCAAFVLWLYWMCGYELRGNFWEQRAVSRLISDARAFGTVLAKDERVEPGDLAGWKYHESRGATGHVALIVDVTKHGDLTTIGGNERLGGKREGVREHALTVGQQSSIEAIIRPSRMLKGVS